MKRHLKIAVLIAGIAVALFALLQSCNSKEEANLPQIKPLIEAVYASGFIISGNEYQAYSQIEGVLTDKLVQDGAAIKKGQALFIIESNQQNARYQLAKEAYELALKNNSKQSPILAEALRAFESSKTKFEFDSVNYIRYQNLINEKATSQSEFDRIKYQYQNSQHEYQLKRNAIVKLQDQLRLELKNAENNWLIAKSENERYIIKSELDGILYKSQKEKGELVRKSEAVATIGESQSHLFKMKIDEQDITRVKIGQEVIVKIDAYANQLFKAKVEKIYPIIDPRDQSVRVDASFIEPLVSMYTGLAAEGNIIIQQKDNALVIPRSLLLSGDSVTIIHEKKMKKVKVITGLETLNEVEIISGIDSKTELAN